MDIVVCIKTVPDTAQLRFDASDNLQKDNLEFVMNPFCEYALETAMRMKEAAGESATLTVISMGDAKSKDALKKALAVGCDNAILINDPQLEGGDAWTGALVLSETIKKHIPNASVVLFGQSSSDAASGMVGPGMAQLLERPSMTFCKSVTVEGDSLKLARETEKGTEHHKMSLPGVVCVMKCDYELRMPAIKGVMKANRAEIPEVTAADLGLGPDQIGANGAYTQVLEAKRKPRKEGGVKVDGSDAQGAVNQLVDFLKSKQVV